MKSGRDDRIIENNQEKDLHADNQVSFVNVKSGLNHGPCVCSVCVCVCVYQGCYTV